MRANLGRRGAPPVLDRPMGAGRQLPQGPPRDLGGALVKAGPLDHDTQAREPPRQGPSERHAEARWFWMGWQACCTVWSGLCCCWHCIHVGSSQLQLHSTNGHHATFCTPSSVLGWQTTAGPKSMANQRFLADLSEYQVYWDTCTAYKSHRVPGVLLVEMKAATCQDQ